jgi:glycosyltransferase involved in cell wall biosynthesis
LRIGVPASLTRLPAATGHGTVWTNLLREIAKLAELVILEDASVAERRRFSRRPEVWLSDGHQGPLAVTEPRVVHLHEAGWHDPELRATIDARFLAAIERQTEAAVHDAAAVLVVSEAARAQVIEQCDGDPSRVHVVRNAVDRATFHPGVPGGGALVEAAGGRPGQPWVLYAASAHPRKNLGALREAMAGIARRGLPHLLVLVVGPAPDREHPESLEAAATAELPDFPGRVVRVLKPSNHELAALMGGADAFCLPSLMEGFGLTALEAMSCGAPVVVSDRGALPEVVGEAGLVVPPTAPAVEEALVRVLTDQDLAARLRRQGPARAALFGWPDAAARAVEVLMKVAGEAR